MSFPRLALILITILVLGEGALGVWRHRPVDPSTAPVFSFPPAAENFDKSPKLAPAVEMYGANRGAEWNTTGTDGTRLTVLYFEWDDFYLGHESILDLAIHAPEVCNTSAGFKLEAFLPERSVKLPGQSPLVFDATRFTDPAGRPVYMFKLIWLQGRGTQAFREISSERIKRISNSLSRHRGAARVVQAGVFNARDADHAWQTFRTQLLVHLEWR